MPSVPVPVRACAAVLAGVALLAGCGTSDSPTAVPAGPASQALPVLGLQDGTTLVSFTTADTNVTNPREITGLERDTRLVGIDHRVRTGDLLGVGDEGGLYTLAEDGAATSIGRLTVALEGERFGVDVNPAADALRIVSDTGQNLRQPLAMTPLARTVEDRALTNPAPPPSTDTVPATGVTAAAYTNDDNDAASGTTLFVIDTRNGRLAISAPANAGTLGPVGGVGEGVDPAVGFDIHTTLDGERAGSVTGWVALDIGGTRNLHRVDLLTGQVETVGALPAEVTDIALPLGG